MIRRNFRGGQYWYPREETPPVVYSPCDPNKQCLNTIEGTARILTMTRNGEVQEADYIEGLKINAERLGITIEDLHSKALSRLESRDNDNSDSETSRIS